MIYLDHNATTSLDPAVFEAMRPWLEGPCANPHSAHPLGLLAEGAMVEARSQVARLLHADPAEVVFTSGGTESLNHALRGVFEGRTERRRVVASAVEHSAVLAVLRWLQGQGVDVVHVPVLPSGLLDLEALTRAITPDTGLVTVMAANNETGVLQPVAEACALAKAQGALFHTDAVQALGRIPVEVRAWGIDLLSFSGHKLHGPKGTGGLFIRRGVRLRPFVLGGEQERGRRGGTENVPGIVGLGKACALATERLAEADGICALRDRLEAGLRALCPDAAVHGQEAPRLPNTTLVSLPGWEGEALLLRLGQKGVCASVGSACTTGQREPSHVLRAMGVPDALGRGTLRFSLGRGTTVEEIEATLAILGALLQEGPGRP